MDLSESALNAIIIILIVLLVATNIYVKRRRAVSTPMGMVTSIYSDLIKNQRLAESFSFHRGVNKFKTGSWNSYQSKVDFLPQELMVILSRVFDMAEDFNRRIDAARSYKSDSYLAAINTDELRVPLATSKQLLQQWIQLNIQNPEYAPPRRRGLFG